MKTIKNEIIEKLREKRAVSEADLKYIKREGDFWDTEEKREFLKAFQECVDFAKRENVKLGPARGTAPALLSFYALGLNDFDPVEHDLLPERFLAREFELHIDVEFKNGRKFIDFCRKVSSELSFGRIEAFKLPILDIFEIVDRKLSHPLNVEEFDDNSDILLDLFRRGDIEKVFGFDFPQNTLLAKLYDQRCYHSGEALTMMSDYLKSQEIVDFQDVLNIEAIFRPDNIDRVQFMKEYIERYPRAKKNGGFYYEELTPKMNEMLKANYGVIIYQEDIEKIINEFTGWGFAKSSKFRRALGLNIVSEKEKKEFLRHANQKVLELLSRESSVAFCKAHSVGAWPKLIKKSALLKALYKDVYYEEIEKWEKSNGYSWGDFGFISNGVSLMQQ